MLHVVSQKLSGSCNLVEAVAEWTPMMYSGSTEVISSDTHTIFPGDLVPDMDQN